MRLPDRGHRHTAIVSNGITGRYPSAYKPTPVIRSARSRQPRFSGYAGYKIAGEAGGNARIVINRPERRNAFDPKPLNNRVSFEQCGWILLLIMEASGSRQVLR